MLFEMEVQNMNLSCIFPKKPASLQVSGSFTSETDTLNPNLEASQALRFDTSQSENFATVTTTALSDCLVFKDV
jgi:hypothetical protein